MNIVNVYNQKNNKYSFPAPLDKLSKGESYFKTFVHGKPWLLTDNFVRRSIQAYIQMTLCC